MKRFITSFTFSISTLLITGQTPDPIPPAEPSIAQFVNLATTSNNIYASQFGSTPITDGTGAADPGTFIIDQSTVFIGTHIYTGPGNPFTHLPVTSPRYFDSVKLEGFINGSVFTTPAPLFIFGTGGQVTIQYFIIDQSLGGTAEPIFLKNTDINLPALGTYENAYIRFVNGKLYAVDQEKIILQPRANTYGGSSSSYFDGTIQKIGAASDLVFVLGDQNIYAPLKITGSNTTQYNAFVSGTSARYYAGDPGNRTALSAGLASVSDKEYYDFITNGDLTEITMETSHFSYGSTDPGKLTIAGWNGTSWVNLQPGGSAGVSTANTIKVSGVLHNNLSQCSKITLAIVNSAVPVKWKTFNATERDGKGELKWTTENIDVQSFTIESSCDGITFKPIGNIKSSGNTYAFTDASPCGKIVYYRITSNDVNGVRSSSEIKAVNFKKIASGIMIWPNPVNQWLNVSISGTNNSVIVQIFDQAGVLIQEQHVTLGQGEAHRINMNKFSAGNYTVKLISGKMIKSEKIIKRQP